MTNLELIQDFYTSENFRDLEFVDSLFHENVVFEWNSSIGLNSYGKDEILKFSKELYHNYYNSHVDIKTIFGNENQVAVRYDYYASTIENQHEMQLIAKVMVIWEFKDNKIIKGFQTTVLQ